MQIADTELGYEHGGGSVGLLIMSDGTVVCSRAFVELGGR